jgi:hypothetical protein
LKESVYGLRVVGDGVLIHLLFSHVRPGENIFHFLILHTRPAYAQLVKSIRI